MKENDLYSLFHALSRIIIIFSIFVLIVGLITTFNQNKPRNQSYVLNTKPAVSPISQSQTKIGTVAAELNLKGPFICQFSSPEATMSGYIKDKKVYAQILNSTKTVNVLLNGDCVYFWQNNFDIGEKFCGFNPYIGIIEHLPLANLIGNNQFTSLFGNFKQYQSLLPIKLDSALPILNSCKKEEIKNGNIFAIPKTVGFKEKKVL